MIAGVINQTICTAFVLLHKEAALIRYGVECKKNLWKPFLTSYLLQTLDYETCKESYAINCTVQELSKDLVTEVICTKPSDFTALTCSISISDVTPVLVLCKSKATIQQLN